MEPTGLTLVVPIDVKGLNDQYGCAKSNGFVKTHRIELSVCKSNQENALVAKIEKVVDEPCMLEESPVGESQSNEIAEQKIQAV